MNKFEKIKESKHTLLIQDKNTYTHQRSTMSIQKDE